MKVDAINGLNYRNNNTFGERIKSEGNNQTKMSSLANNAVKVPVMVLLALNPATLNSAIPTDMSRENSGNIVLAASEKSEADASYVTFPQIHNTQQSNAPYGWEIFNSKLNHIKFSMPAQGNGEPYHMVFTAPQNVDDRIDDVYLIRDGQKGSKRMGDHPAHVVEFRFHNLGSDEENFATVITTESLLGPDRTEIGTMMLEIMLDEPTGQKIIDLLSGDTKWKNSTMMTVREVFDANIQQPKVALHK